MKKYLSFLFIATLTLFISPLFAKAVNDEYNYEISNVSVSGTNLEIRGWSVISRPSDNHQIHNINPIHSLKILGVNAAGNNIIGDSYVYSNTKTQPSVTAASSSAYDYSRAFYYLNTPHQTVYPADNAGRLAYMRPPENVYDNKFYLNVGFVFKIPIQKIKDAKAVVGVKKLYLELTTTVPATAYHVYGSGETFGNGAAASRTFKVGVQETRVNANVDAALTPLKIVGMQTKVKAIVNNGWVNRNPDSFLANTWRYVYCADNTITSRANCVSKGLSYTSLWYRQGEYYDVISSKVLTEDDAEYSYYTVGFERPTAANHSEWARHVPNKKTGMLTWLPAFWIAPIKGTPISIEDEPVPPPVGCEALTSPMQKYCCYHGETGTIDHNDTAVCNDIYKKTDALTTKSATCSETDITSMQFKYPGEAYGSIVADNQACAIECLEFLVTKFDKALRVKAGMGFSYPVTINSSRYCTTNYKTETWIADYNTNKAPYPAAVAAIPPLRAQVDATWANYITKEGISNAHPDDPATPETNENAPYASAASIAYYSYSVANSNYIDAVNLRDALWNNIQELEGDRNYCNSYISATPYNGPESATVSSDYDFPDQGTDYVITDTDLNYDSASVNTFNGLRDSSAPYSSYKKGRYTSEQSVTSMRQDGTNGPVIKMFDFANALSKTKVTYGFPNQHWVQDYTGDLSDFEQDGYVDDGYKSYTSFYEAGNVAADGTGGFDFGIIVSNLGPNLEGTSPTGMAIDKLTCNYKMKNWIFPPTGDINNDLYGNVAFMYRQVSLTDPFPGSHVTGINWKFNISDITSLGYDVYNNVPKYTLTLDSSIMADIVARGTDYCDFDMTDPLNSELLDELDGNALERGV